MGEELLLNDLITVERKLCPPVPLILSVPLLVNFWSMYVLLYGLLTSPSMTYPAA
jgi:hypothetical protein